jgi:hypothetical protein
VSCEQDVDGDAAGGHAAKELDLVHLAAESGLGVEPAVRRADTQRIRQRTTPFVVSITRRDSTRA